MTCPPKARDQSQSVMKCTHQRQLLITLLLAVQCFVAIQFVTYVQLEESMTLRQTLSQSPPQPQRWPSLHHQKDVTATKKKKKKNNIMYFLHIHKSGGHSLCHQAQNNGMIGNFDNVCNVQHDQRCCGGEDSRQAQVDFATSTNWTFVASEREMYDAMATDYYEYVVVLRDSKARYTSHWRHLVSNAQTRAVSSKTGDKVHDRFVIITTSTSSSTTTTNNDGTRYSVGNRTKWWQHQPDNYTLRMICGAKCKDVPKFQITRQLLDYTLRRLDNFSHVLFLEDMERSYNAFAKSVGWKNPVVVDVELHQNAKSANPAKFDSLPVEQAWDPFMSVLDDALYDHARRQYQTTKLHASVDDDSFGSVANPTLVNDYFTNGPKRGCTTPCCGDCSIW